MQRGNIHVIDQIECIRITQRKHDSLPELVQNVHAKVHRFLYRLIIAGADDKVDAIGCTVCNQFLQFFASISQHPRGRLSIYLLKKRSKPALSGIG